jgi:hypothetical protein
MAHYLMMNSSLPDYVEVANLEGEEAHHGQAGEEEAEEVEVVPVPMTSVRQTLISERQQLPGIPVCRMAWQRQSEQTAQLFLWLQHRSAVGFLVCSDPVTLQRGTVCSAIQKSLR